MGPYFGIKFFTLFVPSIKLGHTFKVLDGLLSIITQD